MISSTDANVSSEPQYDPYNVTYQITPPDSSWSIADNGAYTFTLEPDPGDWKIPAGNAKRARVLGWRETLNVEFPRERFRFRRRRQHRREFNNAVFDLR